MIHQQTLAQFAFNFFFWSSGHLTKKSQTAEGFRDISFNTAYTIQWFAVEMANEEIKVLSLDNTS